MIETVNELRTKTSNNPLFVEYYECTVDDETDELIIIMEPMSLMTLKEYVEWYGFLDENSISCIFQQLFTALEVLSSISMFHGNLSINNIFIDQNTMAIKVTDYGLYNCIYSRNTLDAFEGSKMDIFWVGILILKVLGKLRLDMPLDLGNLQYKVPVIKSIYKNESMSNQIRSFLDIAFDKNVQLSKCLVHPFIINGTKPTNDSTRESPGLKEDFKDRTMRDSRMQSLKESAEDKSEFTFGSGNNRNSFSSKSSESNTFPPEVKKFLTKGSGLESSSNGLWSDSQRTSYDYYAPQRFSDAGVPNTMPHNSPAVPLRTHDRRMIMPIFYPAQKTNENQR